MVNIIPTDINLSLSEIQWYQQEIESQIIRDTSVRATYSQFGEAYTFWINYPDTFCGRIAQTIHNNKMNATQKQKDILIKGRIKVKQKYGI